MDWLRGQKQGTGEPEGGLPVSDARPIEDHPRQQPEDPEVGRRRKLRRRATRVLLLTAFIGGGVAALFGEDGLVDMFRTKAELKHAQARTHALLQRVAAEREAIRKLEEEPISRERIAREQLGYVDPGETLLLLPEDEGDTTP
jgi:cell division protein FtsB